MRLFCKPGHCTKLCSVQSQQNAKDARCAGETHGFLVGLQSGLRIAAKILSNRGDAEIAEKLRQRADRLQPERRK